jgi:hypothetical protein
MENEEKLETVEIDEDDEITEELDGGDMGTPNEVE